jgi:uncharacterized protein (DUF488 family)
MVTSDQLEIYTIGFTQKTAENFFGLLMQANVLTLLDVRLNTTSQLSGFAKQKDLVYFLKQICGVEYFHLLDWAPTKEMLNAYMKKEISWESYEDKFLNLMAKRNIERDVKPEIIENGCLLCSEHKPHYCHRRLVVEYLNKSTNLHLNVKHLV